MPKRFRREVALLCLPVIIIGGVTWWKTRDDAPEDVWSGKARLLTRVRLLDVTPIDRYRGYTHGIAIDQWAAGKLPAVPPLKAGVTRAHREVFPRYSPVYVAFRQGKIWKRTLSVFEVAESGLDKSLKIPSVKAQIASLWMETIDSVGQDRGKFTSNYILRLPTSPRVEEVLLCGRTRANIEDREVRIISGVPNDTIAKQSELFSDPMRAKLEIDEKSVPTENVPSLSSRQPDWKVAKVTVFPPGPGTWSNLDIDMSLSPTSRSGTSGWVRLVKPHLSDAKGHEVNGYSHYSSGTGTPTPGTITVKASFQMTIKEWKLLAKPLTFQTALSVNNSWPEEVNLELGRPNTELPVKPSPLPFKREPLPLR
jgi:hypothetical protein